MNGGLTFNNETYEVLLQPLCTAVLLQLQIAIYEF